MPLVIEAPVRGYAHCRDARCPGYAQEEVDAVREESSFTFGELGGDGVFTHLIERSTIVYRLADDEQRACPVCSQPREVTGSHRPQYQPLSGHDPMGLLTVPKFDAGKQHEMPPGLRGETDEEMEARLRREIAEERMRDRIRKEMEG